MTQLLNKRNMTGLWGKIRDYGTLVMFKHTIFSLSFGLVSMILALDGQFLGLWRFMLILIALLSARTGANALNRVIDAAIDGANPRTAGRQIPSGLMAKTEALAFALVCFGIMWAAAWFINPLVGRLAPLALVLMWGYSFTKRFTWLCHLVLGFTCAMAPMGAWLAVTGSFGALEPVFQAVFFGHIAEAWSLFLQAINNGATIFIPLSLFVANGFWVAGFDIIYATQDAEHDRAHGIFSIPARFGVGKALWFSRSFHLLAVLALVLAGVLAAPLGVLYFTGLGLVSALLIYEHVLVKPQNLSLVTIASYHINEVIGVVFLLFSLTDLLFF